MFPRKINHALAISGARTLGFEITDIGSDLCQANVCLPSLLFPSPSPDTLIPSFSLKWLDHYYMYSFPSLSHLKEETDDVNQWFLAVSSRDHPSPLTQSSPLQCWSQVPSKTSLYVTFFFSPSFPPSCFPFLLLILLSFLFPFFYLSSPFLSPFIFPSFF